MFKNHSLDKWNIAHIKPHMLLPLLPIYSLKYHSIRIGLLVENLFQHSHFDTTLLTDNIIQ